MLFFGVPNLGLRYDQLRTIVQDNPNKALVLSLVVDNDAEPSEYLRRISKDFSYACGGYKYEVVNFFERNPTPTVQVSVLFKSVDVLLIILRSMRTELCT